MTRKTVGLVKIEH